MIIEQKKLFFRTVSVILEDDMLSILRDSKKYSSIVGLSYHDLNIHGFSSFSKPTLLIDLKKSGEDILRGFNDTTRNEIRRTIKEESLEIVIENSINKKAYELYSIFEYSQGRNPASLESLSGMVFLGAYARGVLVSGLFVMKCGSYLRIRSIFSKRLSAEDKELYRLIGYATRRLVWEACVWGKSQGFVSLDLASVNINNPKTQSIAKFKMSFGKELTPEYTYIYKSTPFLLFEKLVVLKVLFRKALLFFR